MRKGIRILLGASALVVCSACYHAVIETGLPTGTETVHKAWAHGFLWGLVSPSTVETASKCKNGVARVETQHSFLNGLVNVITYGIYTPIQIDVQCAASKTMGDAADAVHAEDRSPDALRTAIAEAAARAEKNHAPAFVEF